MDYCRLILHCGDLTHYEGENFLDSSKPDGTPRKLMDIPCLIELGWKSKIGLQNGLKSTYVWLLHNERGFRGAN